MANSQERGTLLEEGMSQYKCDICEESYVTEEDLEVHKRTHTDERTLHCCLCDTKFKTVSVFHEHMARHSGDGPFKCNLCMKTFDNYVASMRHKLVYHSPRHRFRMCGKGFGKSYLYCSLDELERATTSSSNSNADDQL